VQDSLDTPSQGSLRAAFERRFDLVFVKSAQLISTIGVVDDYQRLDAVVWHVDDCALREAPAFDWADFRGLRVHFEEDAVQRYSPIIGDGNKTDFPRLFRTHGFHVMVSTGKAVTGRLRAEGIDAHWIPKGFDRERFFDRNQHRDGLCHFGSPYPARAAMLQRTGRAGIAIENLRVPFEALNDSLNRFVGCLICNGELAGARFLPSSVLLWPFVPKILVPGLEPMIKNFEVAAAGCAPICDDIPELADLGFIDGRTMVSYRTAQELIDKLAYYRARPDELRAIGRSAAELARTQHAWDHRAAAFEQLIRARALVPGK
jgi:hypothetical protein